MSQILNKIIDLATSLALEESQAIGTDYTSCLNNSLNEACTRLEVNLDFIKNMEGKDE